MKTRLIIFLSLVLTNYASEAAQKTWNGASGDWFDGNQWTPSGVPSPSDLIIINNGTVSISSPVTISNQLTWAGGSLAGSVLQIAPTGLLSIEGSGTHTMLYCTLDNGGVVNWQGTGDLIAGATYYSQLVVITNRAGGVFNVLNDRTLASADLGYGAPAFRFDNDGTVSKTNSTGTNAVSGVNFNNTGLLNVRSGAVNFNGSGTSVGEFRTTDGTAIYFASGNYVWDKANFSGSGAVRVTGTVGASGSWTSQTLGLVNGGNLWGNFTNNGTFLWTGGTLNGGSLTIPSGSILNINTGSNGVMMTSFTLDNGGTVNWQGTGDLIAGATYNSQLVVITNRAGAMFNVLNDQTLINMDTSGYGAPAFRFDNNGTVRKSSSTGTTTVVATMAFNHGTSGLVEVQSGTLRFPGGFSSAGPMQVSAGARVEMTGGTVQLQTGHQSSGAGYFGVPTGTVTLIGQNVGHLEWTGGTWLGSALTNAPGSTLTLEGLNGNLTLLYSILDNGGVVNWQGAGDLIGGSTYYSQMVVITNRAGGVFNVLNDRTLAAMDTSGYGAPTFRFDNDGTITKTNSIGTNAVNGVIFNNAGLLDVRGGVVNVNGSGTSVGEFRTADGTAIYFASGNYAWDKANFSGNGEVRVTGTVGTSGSWTSQTLGLVSGGNLSGSFTNNGTFLWTGGTFSGGSLTIPSGSILNINCGSNGVLMTSFTLDNGGTVNWQGAGDLIAGATYYSQWVVITNRAGGLFNVLNDQTLINMDTSGYGAPAFRFDNNGTVSKSGSTGATTVVATMAFNHGTSGLVDVQSGTLRFPGGFSSAGPMQVSSGARVEMTGGTVQLQSGHQSSGAGYFGVPTGTVTLIGQNVGHLEWTGGTWVGTMLTNAPGSTLTLEGLNGNLTLLYSVLDNGGVVNWQGTGDLIGGSTSWGQMVVITNRAGGEFNVLNDRSLAAVDTSGGYGAPTFRFDNAGTITKTNATGTNAVSGVNFNNAGLLNVRSGAVNFNGSGTSVGEFRTTDGTAIYFASGNYVWDKANFSGSGAVRVTGTVGASGSWTSQTLGLVNGGNLSGNFTNNGTFLWTGGTLSGGSLTIPSGSILNINSGGNGVMMTSFTLDNGGTVNWQGTGDLIAGATYFSQLVVITNRAGGVFNLLNDQTLASADLGYGAPGFRFDNNGTITKTNSNGTTVFSGVIFNNLAVLNLKRGILHLTGNYNSGSASQLTIGIDGSTPGTQYGQMIVDGTASLAGNIATHLAANYLPTSGQGFTAIRTGVRIGTFANAKIFDLKSVVYFVPTYSGNNVLLTALLSSGAYIPPTTVGMQPGSGLFGFQFPATPGTDYIIDVSSNLVDWKRFTVTNATGPVILFQDPESPSNPCRFYRVFSTE